MHLHGVHDLCQLKHGSWIDTGRLMIQGEPDIGTRPTRTDKYILHCNVNEVTLDGVLENPFGRIGKLLRDLGN